MRLERSSPRATMDFLALPPQRRQGIRRSHAGPDTRFRKRRSDRVAIFCQPLQLLGETYRSFHLHLLSGCANRKTGVVDVVAGEQAPGDAPILVGKRDGDDVRVRVGRAVPRPVERDDGAAAIGRRETRPVIDSQIVGAQCPGKAATNACRCAQTPTVLPPSPPYSGASTSLFCSWS